MENNAGNQLRPSRRGQVKRHDRWMQPFDHSGRRRLQGLKPNCFHIIYVAAEAVTS
jgi:hypothetical protein